MCVDPSDEELACPDPVPAAASDDPDPEWVPSGSTRAVAADPDLEAAVAQRAPAGRDLAQQALAAARAAARQQPPRRRQRRPRQLTGSGPDERDPVPLGALVARLVNDRGWDKTLAEAGVFGRWAELVGPDVAAHCRPERLAGAELTVVAESTAWATQLRVLEPTLLARLAQQVGSDVVRRIRVHGPSTPNWRHGARRVLGRGPRDTYG